MEDNIPELIFSAEVYSICLICGEAIKTNRIDSHCFICDDCKNAVKWAREHMNGGVFLT